MKCRYTSAAKATAYYFQGRFDERHEAAQRLGKWTRWDQALARGFELAETMARVRAKGKPVVDEQDIRLAMGLVDDEIRASEPTPLDYAFFGAQPWPT